MSVGFCFLLEITGCGSNGGGNGSGGGDGGQSFQYQFTVNGCDTGTQKFATLQEMCAGLESSSLNHDCALSSRQSFFQEKCTGTFQETT